MIRRIAVIVALQVVAAPAAAVVSAPPAEAQCAPTADTACCDSGDCLFESAAAKKDELPAERRIIVGGLGLAVLTGLLLVLVVNRRKAATGPERSRTSVRPGAAATTSTRSAVG